MKSDLTHLLVKYVEGKRIAWFEQANQWVQLEEPAWFVYKLSVKGLSPDEVIARCQKKYGSGKEESTRFVTEILNQLYQFQQPQASPLRSPSPALHPSPVLNSSLAINWHSVRSYRINNQLITLFFQFDWLEYNVHPLLAHLEIPLQISGGESIELFQIDAGYYVRLAKDPNRTWVFDKHELQKGRAFIEILNTIFGKKEENWMTIVHGSAITDGKSTILFSSACGGGKSTMAALLHANGFQVLSDDMVPVEAKSRKIYPFPAALSVKAGAIPLLIPYFPDLATAKTFDFPTLDKQVRYLPLNQSLVDKGLINKAKILIFIKYDRTEDLRLEKISKLEAIKLFNEEAWISPTPENAKSYINWFLSLTCYKLTYSNNESAILKIRQLFNAE
jgi:hypothetical protein